MNKQERDNLFIEYAKWDLDDLIDMSGSDGENE